MFRSKRTLSLLLPAALVTLTLAAAPSLAVVGGITDLAEFSDPASPYYGMDWSYNYLTGGGTSVAIGYFTLLTADHYFIPAGKTFTINGDSFIITSTDLLPADAGYSTPDLRVVHVKNLTNEYRPLPGFYDLYTYSGGSSTPPINFPPWAQSFLIVGSGDTGETTIPIADPPYYQYTPYYTDTANTRGLRWGTNRFTKFDREEYTGDRGPHSTMCTKMVYVLPTSRTATVHESGLGIGDSGCGVFVNDKGTWKLAGVGLYRDYYDYPDHPDRYSSFYAASIPFYASRLYNILQYDVLPGDLNLDGNVDSSDFVTLQANFGKTGATWYDGDFNVDGVVDGEDLFALKTNFGYRSTPHPTMTPPSSAFIPTGGISAMPEPGSAILLVLGAAALLRRRGGQGKSRNP